MKNLPKMYKNENPKIIEHNKNVCYVQKEEKEIEPILFELLHNMKNRKQKIWIKTSKKEYETYIIARAKQKLITIDNEEIPISEIIDIQIIK